MAGNFTNAEVDLSNNKLTRFESAVFQPMLEQMVSTTEVLGSLSVRNSNPLFKGFNTLSSI